MPENDPGQQGNQQQGNQQQNADGGGQNQNSPPVFTIDDAFIATLPDDLKAEPSIGAFKGKGVADVLKSHVNAQRMVGADKVVIPAGKLDTEEAWNALYDKLGRPSKPDEYVFDAKPPEGIKVVPEFEASVKALSHKIGLSGKQANQLNAAIMGWIGETTAAHQAAVTKESEAAAEKLKAEWGGKYDANLALAARIVDTYGGKAEEAQAFKDQFGNNPVAIRILATIGNLIGDGSFVKGEGPAFTNTPEEAHKKAMDIMTNTQNPLHEAYHKRNHMRHKEAVEEVEKLFIVAKGNEPVDKR
jgi:hypothetical protein